MSRHLSDFGIATIITSWCFVLVAIGAVVLNIALTSSRRGKGSRLLEIEEYITGLALVMGIALSCQTTWAIVLEGSGEHQSDFTHDQINVLARSLIIHETLWIAANGFIRLAAYQLLMRIFVIKDRMPRLRWCLISLTGLSILYPIASVLEVLLTCRPLAAQWDASIGKCGNQKDSFIAVETIGLVLDLPLFLIPVKVIWGLQLSTKRKAKTMFVFQIGLIVTAITILRIKSLSLATSPDFIYAKSYLGLLSTVGSMTSIALAQTSLYIELGKRISRIWEEKQAAVWTVMGLVDINPSVSSEVTIASSLRIHQA